MVDTHTHIFSQDFDSDIEKVIERALSNGVNQCYLPNIDIESISSLNSLCDKYPDMCFPMMGLHPTSIGTNYPKDLSIIRNELEKRNYIAIGEIGIDLYWDKTYKKEQIEVFEEQLRWSLEFDLAVVIHTREAFPEVFESIYKIGANKLRGVFHSFGGSLDEMEKALQCENFLLGINGVITYKNAHFADHLAQAPLNRIILETDAPYLTPVPYRGKRNEPSYLIYIAEKLSKIYNISIDEIARQTTTNARSLFLNK